MKNVDQISADTFESNPGLSEQLRARGISEVVVFGVQSECCVEATCKGALAAGFKVTLLQGAHSTYDTENETALQIEERVDKLLGGLGVKLVPWKEAF